MHERRQLQAVLRGQKISFMILVGAIRQTSGIVVCPHTSLPDARPTKLSCRKEDFRMNEDRTVQTKPGGGSVKNQFFTRVLRLSMFYYIDFASQNQPQFPKKGRLSTSESHGY